MFATYFEKAVMKKVLTLFGLGFSEGYKAEGGGADSAPLSKIFKNDAIELNIGGVIVLHKIYQKK